MRKLIQAKHKPTIVAIHVLWGELSGVSSFVWRGRPLGRRGLQIKRGQFDSDELLLASVESIDFRQRRLQPGIVLG
jgi:hypothetical protein